MLLDWETYYAVRWGQWKYFNYRHDAPTYRCSEPFNNTLIDNLHYMRETEQKASDLNSNRRKMKLFHGQQLYNLHHDPFEIHNRENEIPNRKWLLKRMQEYAKTELSKGHRLPAVADTKSKPFFTELKSLINRYWEEPMDFLVETDRVVKDLPSNDNYFASIGQNWCSVVDVQLKQALDKSTQQRNQQNNQYPSRLQNDVAIIKQLKGQALAKGRKDDISKIQKALSFSPLFTNNYTPPKLHYEYATY